MNSAAAKEPRPPAHVEPYVDVLGFDLAVKFLLTFGGSVVYLPEKPAGRSEVEALIGAEKVIALRNHPYQVPARVPTAKRWLARALQAKGLSTNKIARKLHVSDVTVRNYLRDDTTETQLSLF